jgi:hypothetical protein
VAQIFASYLVWPSSVSVRYLLPTDFPVLDQQRYLSDSTGIKCLADGSSLQNTAEDSKAVARAMGALCHLSAKGLRQLAIKATFLPQMYTHSLIVQISADVASYVWPEARHRRSRRERIVLYNPRPGVFAETILEAVGGP